METDRKNDLLTYAKANINILETGSISSNKVCFFEWEGKRYVIKIPFVTGDGLSPFWLMMKNIFHFTFQKQNKKLDKVYHVLKENPHIQAAPFVAADEEAAVFEFVKGSSRSEDEFPEGNDNAFLLGQYIGYNHQVSHNHCGILGTEDVRDFFQVSLSHMETCINLHWNSGDDIDVRVRAFFEKLKKRHFKSSRYSLIMVDISADQFLYDGDDIAACADLDAYVIGPVEWELSFLRKWVRDWRSFQRGYETYQSLPPFEEMADFFYYLMALNSCYNKSEMETYWSKWRNN